MNTQDIATRLTAIQSALVEKTGEQPILDISLSVRQSGTASVWLPRGYNNGEHDVGTAEAHTIEGALDEAYSLVAAMPDADETKKRDFQKSIAKVIDEGEGINAPAEVMTPLRASMNAMTENLLTHDVAS